MRPLLINIISASIIVVFGFALSKAFTAFPVFRYFIEDLLKVDGQIGSTVLTLALAYTIGVIINTILHWWVFERVYNGFTKPVLSTLFQCFSASVIMGYFTFLCLRIFAAVFPLTKIWGVFMQGLFSGIIGIVILIIILKLLKNRQIDEVWATLHHKIWKAKVPPAEVERIA